MLTKAVIKWRINCLYSTINRMNSASSKIGALTTSLNNLEKAFQGSVKIDDNVPYQEYMNGASNSLPGIKSNLSGKIVNSLYYRIKDYKKKLEE